MKSDFVLGIIPARSGSKRVRKKNTRDLLGKPLIEYTMDSSKKSKLIDKLVVSTDDDEIKQLGLNNKIEVVERPLELAQDTSSAIDVVLHAIDEINNKNLYPDIIILLQPTSPFRTAQDIDNSLNLFLHEYKRNNCMSLVSLCEYEHSPYWSMTIKEIYTSPFFGHDYINKRGQDLPKLYRPNGAIYISTPRILKECKTFYTYKTLPYIMPHIYSVDIDEEIDFKFAEFLLNEGMLDDK